MPDCNEYHTRIPETAGYSDDRSEVVLTVTDNNTGSAQTGRRQHAEVTDFCLSASATAG